MTVRAFGWKAAHLEAAPTPVGAACLGCDLVVAAGDEGVVLPGTDEQGVTVDCAWHRTCFLQDLGLAEGTHEVPVGFGVSINLAREDSGAGHA